MEIHIYTAGLFDGEGTVTLTKRGKSRLPIVSVTSTTYELLQFLKQTYGGTISKQKVYKKHHKQSWSWKAAYDTAISFLSSITPYLKEPAKRYRAQLILSEYKSLTKRNGKYSQEELSQKIDFEHRFFHPSTPVKEPMSL